MKKHFILTIVIAVLILTSMNVSGQIPAIGTPILNPVLNITHFDAYVVSVPIEPNGTDINTVTLTVTPKLIYSGEKWDYFTNGTPDPNSNAPMNFTMTKKSGEDVWEYTNLRPDLIYPQILFAPYSVTSTPPAASEMLIDDTKVQLLKFTNPYAMVANSSFFIEIYAEPQSLSGPPSVDLQVYLVGAGKTSTFFTGTNWLNDPAVELVRSINKDTPFQHAHNEFTMHHLVPLTTNANGTIGSKGLVINGDFWVVLTTSNHLTKRGWRLKYHPAYPNNNTWYQGNGSTAPVLQTGAPDVHVHIARAPEGLKDGVELKVTVDYTGGTEVGGPTNYYFGTIPNLAPNASSFTAPPAGTYSGYVTISWNKATDPNNDALTYMVEIINPTTQAVIHMAATGLTGTSLSFNTTLVSDGIYDIKVTASDGTLTTGFLWSSSFGSGFIISNSNPIKTWDGSESTSWNISANWTPEGVPGVGDDVNIPDVITNDPVIPSGLSPSVSNLALQAGAILTLESTAKLTITGTLTNNTGELGLVLQSNSAGTASLLHNSPFAEATIQRYITGSSILTENKYHMVSVPLTQSSDPVSGLFLGSYLYEFDAASATQQWVPLGAPTTDPLLVNKGYMIYYPGANITYSFAGLMNNGTFNAATDAAGAEYFHLVPNPYPSAVDWNAASGWIKQNLYNAIWIWNSSNTPSPAYTTYINGVGTNGGTNFVPAGQAFFVQASSAAQPALIMNNEVRVHSTQPFFKETMELTDILRLKAVSNGFGDEIVIRFVEDATMGFDGWTDASKLFGFDGTPQLYSVAEDSRNLAINSIPFTTEVVSIPVGFYLTQPGEVTFNATGLDSFDPNVTIFLFDHLTGNVADLRLNPQYTFQHNPANDPVRFAIVFNSSVSIEEVDYQGLNLSAWFADHSLNLIVPEEVGEHAMVNLFNVNGQLVTQTKVASGNTSIPVTNLSKGLYIIQLTGSRQSVTKKIIFN